ncbi:MAG TPA: hypothetical protein VGC13_10025 [Longimicrobium sp.]|jgi:hypothetical protein|uniref:hypothetical protein n=1 Tax=Longimicrobium sp. TaxID=2029185 RepID=UPI002EDB755C
MNTIAQSPPIAGRPLQAPAERLIAGVRAAWRRSVLLRALAWAPALFAASAVLLVLIDLVLPIRAVGREVLRWLPVALGGGVLALCIQRLVRPPAPRRFALLAEERIPALQNRLLTAFDLADPMPDGVVGRAFVAEAERHLRDTGLRDVAPARVRTPGMILGGSLALAAAFALAFPGAAAEAWTRWMHPADAYASTWQEVRAETLPNVEAPPIPLFDELRWTVQPPAYAGIAAQDGRGDDPISALPGSRVRIRSRFPDRWDGVRAGAIGGASLPVRRDGGEWIVEYVMPPDARGLSLEAMADGGVVDRRIVPLAPLPDQPPDVQLLAPEADLVLASGVGRIGLRATAADDYGVGRFDLHWTHSRGSGESYEFVEGDWAFSRVSRNGRTSTGELVIDLGTLRLQPGDIMHIRAVARDRNNVTGPGESVSRTRIIRVARPDEMDQINTDIGVPAELPKDPVMSQRMIILMTERLIRERPRLSRQELQSRAAEIAQHQSRLREVVGEQVYVREAEGAIQQGEQDFSYLEQGGSAGTHAHEEGGAEEEERTPEQVLEEASEATGIGAISEFEHRHDESAILDVNRDLMRLHNLMWNSQQELNLVKPDTALPYQYEALKIIQALNQAERTYPRGDVRVDPINVSEARGQGKMDDVAPAARSGGAALASLLPLLAELDRVAAGLGRKAGRASSLEISNLAARVLGEPTADRDAAAFISRAAGEAGNGRTERARDLLRRARERLAPPAGAAARPLPSTADPAAAEYFRRLGRPQ